MWHGNTSEEKRVYGGQPRPSNYWVLGSSVPQIFGTSYMRAHSMKNSNQILYGDRTRCEEIFTGSTTPPDLAKIVGDANADVRSVCDS